MNRTKASDQVNPSKKSVQRPDSSSVRQKGTKNLPKPAGNGRMRWSKKHGPESQVKLQYHLQKKCYVTNHIK